MSSSWKLQKKWEKNIVVPCAVSVILVRWLLAGKTFKWHTKIKDILFQMNMPLNTTRLSMKILLRNEWMFYTLFLLLKSTPYTFINFWNKQKNFWVETINPIKLGWGQIYSSIVVAWPSSTHLPTAERVQRKFLWGWKICRGLLKCWDDRKNEISYKKF